MAALETTLIAALASAGINLAIALPLMLMAWRRADRRNVRWLGWMAGLYVLDWFVLMMPHYGPFARMGWNWQGKLLEIAWPLLFAAFVPGMGLSRIGLRWRPASGMAKAILLSALTVLVIVTVVVLRTRSGFDRETFVFELTMPGLSEEIVYRGVFQSLLNQVWERRIRVLGAPVGWGLWADPSSFYSRLVMDWWSCRDSTFGSHWLRCSRR
jgi:CAAX protease family protein